MKKLQKVELSPIWESDIYIECSENIEIVHDIANNAIVIEKKSRSCFCCKSEKNIKRFKDRYMCQKCINEIKAM